MKAIYQEKPNCQPCIDIYGPDVSSECKHCMELHRYEVEVLQLGVGLFGNKAVIRKENGKLETVLLSALTMKGEDDGNSSYLENTNQNR